MTEGFRIEPRIIQTDLKNEMVLLDPISRRIYRLNATARRVWLAFPLPDPGAVARVLAEGQVVPADRVLADARALLDGLVAEGLVVPPEPLVEVHSPEV